MPLAAVWMVIIVSAAYGETAVRDSAALEIAQYVWFNQFDKALNKAENIIDTEPDNPLGYFLKGSIYQTISEEYRNDKFADEIDDLLSKAIKMAKKRKKTDKNNPDWYFIIGSSYGYRALLRAFHGGWFSAFKDGLKCSSNLEDALELDSTFYDAWLGLGAYHYYKTIKSKDFLWLPFVSDRREQGINEIVIASQNGLLAWYTARESFVRIYYIEERYDDLLLLADSLDTINPDDPYCMLYHAQGLIKMGHLDDAAEKIRTLRNVWRQSPYYDAIGQFEAELMTAQLFIAEGDTESAKKILNRIIDGKDLRESNAYFAETYNKAKDLSKLCR